MNEIIFEAFPKIPRLKKDGVVITEKLDGTNAQVIITEDGQIGAASRNRLITPDDDNYGFARWVQENREELLKLGPGRHFGEWWGQGIQRGYGLEEKRFSLFNVHRWTPENVPTCCHTVPVLHEGAFDSEAIEFVCSAMEKYGSTAAPGYMNPEGIIVFHRSSKQRFKVLLENDDKHKGELK